MAFFYLIGDPGTSDHPFPIGVLTGLNLFLHARSTETKKQLIVDFQGKDWHILMPRRKDAAFNETFVILKKVKIFGNDLGASQRNLTRFIDEWIERGHIEIFDFGVFICLDM